MPVTYFSLIQCIGVFQTLVWFMHFRNTPVRWKGSISQIRKQRRWGQKLLLISENVDFMYLNQCFRFSQKPKIQSQESWEKTQHHRATDFLWSSLLKVSLTESSFLEPFWSAITMWLFIPPQYPTSFTVCLPTCSINEMGILKTKCTSNSCLEQV